MKGKISDRLDLALPAGISLMLSTVALLLFPGLVTVACQLLIGLILVGSFISKKVLRYAKKRRADRRKGSPRNRRMVDRGDMLVLIAFATFYAAVSGPLTRAGWPGEAVRSCALFLLLSILLLKPRIAARLKTKTKNCGLLPQSTAVSPSISANENFTDMVNQGRIQ